MYRVQRRKKGILFYVVLFVCAFSVGLGIGYGVIKSKKEKEEPFLKQETLEVPPVASSTPPNHPASLNLVLEEPEATQGRPQYFVINQKDGVCVFSLDENGKQKFSHKLAIELDSLPEVDQKLFNDGITLYSKQELLELTEDFSS